jgi:hypothetical protein
VAAWDLYNIIMEYVPDVNVGVGDHASILVGSSLSSPFSPFVTPLPEEYTPLPPHPSPLRYRSTNCGSAWEMSEFRDGRHLPFNPEVDDIEEGVVEDDAEEFDEDEEDDDASVNLSEVSSGAVSAISIMTDALRAACEVLDDYMESLKESNRSIRDLKSRIKLSKDSSCKRQKVSMIV